MLKEAHLLLLAELGRDNSIKKHTGVAAGRKWKVFESWVLQS